MTKGSRTLRKMVKELIGFTLLMMLGLVLFLTVSASVGVVWIGAVSMLFIVYKMVMDMYQSVIDDGYTGMEAIARTAGYVVLNLAFVSGVAAGFFIVVLFLSELVGFSLLLPSLFLMFIAFLVWSAKKANESPDE